MAITNRIKRLFRADVNAILDVIEEPDAILKQAIREMQEALDRDRGQLARTDKNIEALRQREAYYQEVGKKLQSDLDLCLVEGPEDLTRKTIGRKLSSEKQLSAVQRQINLLERSRETKAREVDAQQDQLEAIVEKASFYVNTRAEDTPFSVADSILASPEAGTGHVTEEEIEMEWIRIRDKGEKS